MKNLLLAIALLFAIPTFAQWHSHDKEHARGHFPGDNGHHTDRKARNHYDGHRFDHEYHARYFGREHRFRHISPVFYAGRPRFYYGNFWYDVYEPWPEYWSYNDDFYVDYDEGAGCYYMYNLRHEGDRLRIGVVF